MQATKLIACSRMYNVSPAVRACWDALFVWLSRQAGVALDIIAHEAPAPLSELWARSDMGAVFMCGYPFSQLSDAMKPVVLAAPVAKAAWSGNQARYASHILVRRGGPIRCATDLPNATWGWTVRDSQSGYHAPRAFLAKQMSNTMEDMRTVGPLINPWGIIQALQTRRIEAGAVDAYAYELLLRHQPDAIAGLEIVATTAPRPSPMLVSARCVPAESLSAFRQALLTAHERADGRDLLETLALARFDCPEAGDYAVLKKNAETVDRSCASW